MIWDEFTSFDTIAQIINEHNVGILVNSNINMLKPSFFHSQSGQNIQKALNTNVVFLTRFINLVLPKMIEKYF
jgi:short-subunit dehydrogenase